MNPNYIIERFDKKQHEIKDFHCGIDELDRYVKERAGQESRKNVAVVYIIREKDSAIVIGYYTLSSYSIELTDLPENIVKKLPRYPALPAILIRRFAVATNYQGKRIGEYMLLDALNRSYDLSKQIGSIAVVVDAKNEKSRNFFEKYGFMRSLEQPFKLYILMGTIKMLIDQK